MWQDQVYEALKRAGVRQLSYVPDAGHARLIERADADPEIQAVVLTTEEEGVAMAAGAWLGGQRAVLLMQSSGVGNTINMLSLPQNCRMPFLTLVTMRGEWGEFNPWQVPMGSATESVLRAAGIHVHRADHADEVADMVGAAAALAFDSAVPVAVLFSQRLIGAKVFVK
ncbi:MAG TPA: thiamine pyrophosphate-binding protein [Acetobacteraceae bacterium]|nr:thiamine pyrophosphate-binding protein [Acetobacteraceae bacterium]